MDGSYPSRLHIWDEWSTGVAQDAVVSECQVPVAGPHHAAEFAERLYTWEALDPAAPTPRPDEGTQPYTLQWFLDIENQRHGRHGRWIPHLLEFSKHSGETLLGLGSGLGTDWLQYARHGAAVVVCSAASEQLKLIRRNFELRGLNGRFLHSTPGSLPLVAASIDVVCVSGLLDEVADPTTVVDELYRVLKPGGKAFAVTPAYYDADFWYRTCFPLETWFQGKRGRKGPGLTAFTARSLRRLFGRFVEHRVYKRHLGRSDVPHVW